MSHNPLETNCLNCQAWLGENQQFCSACGQKTSTHRLTMGHFIHEAFHALTHADKGIFHLIKNLATRPGSTAREYLTGRRKAYFNPFTFFLISMGLFVFLNVYIKPAGKPIHPDAGVVERMPSKEAREQYISTMHRVSNVSRFTRNNGNLIAMIAIPYISIITWMFFRKSGYNYAEHLTANMMFLTFCNLLFAVTVFPLQAAARGSNAAGYIPLLGLVLQALYLAWCLNGLLRLRSAQARAKSFAVSFLSIILWALFSMLVMAVYIYQGWNFYKFFTGIVR